LLAVYSQQDHWDAQPPVVETQPHMVGRFTPARLLVNLQYGWMPFIDVQPVPPQETFVANPHYIATYKPASLAVPLWLRTQQDYLPRVVETNVHFIARFTQPPTWQFRFNSWCQRRIVSG
jgi:hypothetical protein